MRPFFLRREESSRFPRRHRVNAIVRLISNRFEHARSSILLAISLLGGNGQARRTSSKLAVHRCSTIMRNCCEEDRSEGSEKSRGKRGYTAATTFVHIVCKSSNARIIHIADSGERTYVSRRFHARTPKQIASYIITREKRTRANARSIP